MIALVSRPVARPPIDCAPAPTAVCTNDGSDESVPSVVAVGSVVVGVVTPVVPVVELPIAVIHYHLW